MLNENGITFFHSFQLGDGLEIKGKKNIETLHLEASAIFKYPVEGKTVIDIGAWDGYFSFEAEKLGASRVLATDHHCWSGPGWGTKAGFNYIHKALGSRVESLDVDVFALDPALHGVFDVAIFSGVLYHLRDPVGGLQRAASMTSDVLIIETLIDMDDFREPVARYYVGKELNGDPTNFWGPNTLCVEGMLRDMGFSRFEHWKKAPGMRRTRLITHAWRK
ncbi:MAG: DUF1698 domain-containing protein [Ancalomicrobiaceae bacterium]|nr:DUF1698 domain-containing protein [Ancalomicrobiaceae bacterium]